MRRHSFTFCAACLCAGLILLTEKPYRRRKVFSIAIRWTIIIWSCKSSSVHQLCLLCCNQRYMQPCMQLRTMPYKEKILFTASQPRACTSVGKLFSRFLRQCNTPTCRSQEGVMPAQLVSSPRQTLTLQKASLFVLQYSFLSHLARHALIHSRASRTFSGVSPPAATAPAGASFGSPLCTSTEPHLSDLVAI